MPRTDIPDWFLFRIAIRDHRALLHCGAGFADEAQIYDKYGFNRVVWIEANPSLLGEIIDNLSAYPYQEVYCAALWDEDDCELKLYSASNVYSSSLLTPKQHIKNFPQISFVDGVTVKTRRLDSLQLEFPFSSVLVMDLQGAEARALRGARKTINQMAFVYSEFSLSELYEGGSTLTELREALGEDFEILIKAEDSRVGYGNVLFIRKGRRKNFYIRFLWLLLTMWDKLRLLLSKLKSTFMTL